MVRSPRPGRRRCLHERPNTAPGCAGSSATHHRFDLFDYSPEHHYRTALDGYERLLGGPDFREWIGELLPEDVETDGGLERLHNGKQRATVYYGLNPETGTALHHATANGEEATVFFGNEDRAEEYLERLSDGVDSDRYDSLSPYQARTRKVKDAVDVLMDQSGLDEFVPDG